MIAEFRKDLRMYGAKSRSKVAKYYTAFTSLGLYVGFLYRFGAMISDTGTLGKAISRIIEIVVQIISGCYISSQARIAGGLYLPHPTGVVIGMGVTIEECVTIYQHVTLGSGMVGAKTYPYVEREVVIFANAIIVGSVRLAQNSKVGAGAVVLKDVPTGCVAVGNPARIIQPKGGV